ncbi:MAG: Fe2+-dependent dioxygenase [Oxalicibacterium faecigallinarum]|uniref:PKHD-type hydroxylase PiuC n=1 Tax=Oxalicibacterium faecigallinarum TaxID=573741 RepID=A0A8J3AUS7_9BURK|nr:Fe2+-dependent dioxygenase [Oxalicibacterium faecigallinarum]MDQ7968344.1 Fe2+-dependent dioxygenase [Oxalicibacterium faecigallinarum]GGI17252.1 PKHD-type hydroxylase PiuC [Oxalicibacterium faecigallinarum]
MMLQIPGFLSPDQLRQFQTALSEQTWEDGRQTAGHMAAKAKNNQQLAHDNPVGTQLSNFVLEALGRNPLFMSAALPLKVVPPMFNRYESGGTYGDHVDGAIRSIAGTPHRIRTDISATLFLSDPDSYDGGELVVNDTYGERATKLNAGDMILYPGTSLHHVRPVTRGVRLACFFWVQSLVRDDTQRTMLFELDTSIQQLVVDVPDHPAPLKLSGVYHNLLRQWSDT